MPRFALTFFTLLASKGSRAHLLKVGSKRRRTKAEIRDNKQRIAAKDSEFDLRMDRIRELEAELNNSKSKNEKNQNAHDIVQNLINQNILQLDENNQVIPSQPAMAE